jgi:hypothetical protein
LQISIPALLDAYYKIIIGNKLKSRSIDNQKIESKIAVNILNQMTNLGMPCSQKIA